ncbi:cathepsin K-like [Clupea harengus]|uniref:Cathepsin K-like n=1 Tax=Clupea harengus TaxID=7950 RepID=A0A6P8FVG1_CLUHA|nr:cathepsin K-like [Clupea harengus]
MTKYACSACRFATFPVGTIFIVCIFPHWILRSPFVVHRHEFSLQFEHLATGGVAMCIPELLKLMKVRSVEDELDFDPEAEKANFDRHQKPSLSLLSYCLSVSCLLQGEEAIRRTIWEKNMQLIEAHNQEYELGIHTYELGMNHLGDMTTEEVVEKMMGFRPDVHAGVNNTFVPDSQPVPSCIDYRKKGYVTSVKNQGICGSCWAFSAVGALEGQLMKKGKELVDLSPQNLVDCVVKNSGCHGGFMTFAFGYVSSTGGIASEKAYPYTGMHGKCVDKTVMKAATCTDFMILPHGNEDMLRAAVAQVGPIAVGVNASQPTFNFYKREQQSKEQHEGNWNAGTIDPLH